MTASFWKSIKKWLKKVCCWLRSGVEDSIGLVCCSWVSWWGGQLERRERSCFWGPHASFVLSSAPPYLFSWLLVLWGSLSLLFPVSDWGFLYTHILRHPNSFFLVLHDAFFSLLFKTNILFLYSLFSSSYICFMFILASFSGVLFSLASFSSWSWLFYAIAQLPSLADIAV